MPSQNTRRSQAGVAARAAAAQPPEFGDPQIALQRLMSKEQQENLKYIDVEIEGQLLRFHYRELGWMGKNAAISKAQVFEPTVNQKTGQGEVKASIRQDLYYEEALRRMLINPPLPMTAKIIERLSDEAGSAFEGIIPPMFDSQTLSENLKKKLEASSPDETA